MSGQVALWWRVQERRGTEFTEGVDLPDEGILSFSYARRQ